MAEADGALDAGAGVDDEAVAEVTLVIVISILTKLTGGSNLYNAINSLLCPKSCFRHTKTKPEGDCGPLTMQTHESTASRTYEETLGVEQGFEPN